MKEDINVEDGVVFLNNKLIVPTSMRPYVLNLLHESHLGIQKCKSKSCYDSKARELKPLHAGDSVLLQNGSLVTCINYGYG